MYNIAQSLRHQVQQLKNSQALPASYSSRRQQTIAAETRARLGSLEGVLNSRIDPKLRAKGSQIEKVSIIDLSKNPRFDTWRDLRLKVDFSSPQEDPAAWLSRLNLFDSRIAMVAGKDFSVGTNMLGIGPYVLRENSPDGGVVIEASPRFHIAGLPRTKVIDFRYFSKAGSALSALRVGAIDIIALPTSNQIQRALEDPTLVVLDSPLRKMTALGDVWFLPQKFWSKPGEPSDRLSVEKIIVRRTLEIDNRFLSRFELSGTFLP